LRNALGVARNESAQIDQTLTAIGSEFQSLSTVWQSPSFVTFQDMQTWFTTSADDLRNLLEDAVKRMDRSIKNYEDAERANFNNAT
jgi:WXG100 family type VII secretion target